MDTTATRDELLAAFARTRCSTSPPSRSIQRSTSGCGCVRRALPLFCPPTGCAGSEAHVALQNVIDSSEPDPSPGRKILRLRAAIEALGIARTGDDNDIVLLVPFLSNGSRDLRATTARALSNTCNVQAIPPLRARADVEQVQVRLAISAALGDLAQRKP